MRGMYTDAILMAIAERPGIRAVEIADKVDCDIEAVERSIREEIDAGNVRREIITGPNAKPTLAFWMKDTPAGKPPGATPKAPKAVPVQSVAVSAAPAPAAIELVPSAPEVVIASPPPATIESGRTKVDILMDFIRSQPDQAATDDQLRQVIGLRKDQHPSTFLSTQRRRGEIHKDIDMWRLGPRKTIGSAAAPEAPVIDPDADFRCALWSDGELQLARGDQIALRLSAAEVGHLRNYLAGSRAP